MYGSRRNQTVETISLRSKYNALVSLGLAFYFYRMDIMNLRKYALILIEVFNVRLEYIGRAQLEIYLLDLSQVQLRTFNI